MVPRETSGMDDRQQPSYTPKSSEILHTPERKSPSAQAKPRL